MGMNQNRAWAEIDLSALEHNFDVIQKHTGRPVMCIVKANAYAWNGAAQPISGWRPATRPWSCAPPASARPS